MSTSNYSEKDRLLHNGEFAMATLEDARRIAVSLPEAKSGFKMDGQFYTQAAGKGFARTWMERVTQGKPRVACPPVESMCFSAESITTIRRSTPSRFFQARMDNDRLIELTRWPGRWHPECGTRAIQSP